MERLQTNAPIAGWQQIILPEYLLVAYPDAGVNEKLLAEKRNLTDKYLPKPDTKTQPYITIASFMARETMEDTIIRYTQRICSQRQSFKVELNNYSGFPPGTIYLRVQNPQPFYQLSMELAVVSNYITSCDCPPAFLKTHPHVKLSQFLPEPLYLQAMMDYSQKTFHEAFTVNELVLLRRSSAYDALKKIHVFRFQPESSRPDEKNFYN